MKTKDLSEKLPEILTLRQACGILNCHPNTLRKWVDQGKIEAIRFGSRGDRRFKRDDIEKILKNKITKRREHSEG